MDKHRLPNIELFAAYLDGNLSENEMQQMSKLLEKDGVLHQMAESNLLVDNTIASFNDSDLQLPPEFIDGNFELPDINTIDSLLVVDDSFLENDTLYKKESETLNNRETMATSYRTYGASGENIISQDIQQPDNHSCALRSQQIILRDFGIDIPFEDLERYALDAGLYSDSGTYTFDIGKVLEMAGIGMHQIENGTVFDLMNELAKGHRIIVSVDANELWYNDTVAEKMANWLKDVLGAQGGNHALIVAGIEVNPFNVNDVQVVLTDPGTGHLRIEYPLDQFVDAWKDSNCFIAATDNSAPYQYDSETGMEVPSNFVVEHQYNQFVIENNYQLESHMIHIPNGYTPVFTGHLDMIGDLTYDDYLNAHHSHISTGELTMPTSGIDFISCGGESTDYNKMPFGEENNNLFSSDFDEHTTI